MINENRKFLYDGNEPSMRRIGVVWSFLLLTMSLLVQYFTSIAVPSDIINSLVGLVIVALGSTAFKKKDKKEEKAKDE